MAVRWQLLVAVLTAAVMACTGDGNGHGNGHAQEDVTQESEFASVVYETADGRSVPMTIEVADTDELRTCGLMHRTSMDENHGMLFVFQQDSNGAFWNRNTFIPLTLAWITVDGVIANITDMDPVRPEDRPQRNTLYPPGVTYRYVIEANHGWYARNNVNIGDKVRLDEALARGSQNAAPICREKGTEPVGGE
jgi:uncharacterized protein